MQPISSLSKRKTANYDQSRTTTLSTNGLSKIGTSHLSSHKPSTDLVGVPASQSSMSNGDTITSTSRKAINGKQHSSPPRDNSSQLSCSSA